MNDFEVVTAAEVQLMEGLAPRRAARHRHPPGPGEQRSDVWRAGLELGQGACQRWRRLAASPVVFWPGGALTASSVALTCGNKANMWQEVLL
jgi:hypothetical protein